MYIVDAHLDLAFNASRGRDITRHADEQLEDREWNGTATVGLPNLRAGKVAFVCATIFAMPTTPKDPGYNTPDEAQVAGWNQLQYYLSLLKRGEIDLITDPTEIPTAPAGEGNPLPVILLMEGADPIVAPTDLPLWFNAGLRIIGLAWKQTRYAGGTGAPGPLTPLGVQLVQEIDRLGIIHDISHLAEESFWQLLDLTPRPVFASHSNCRTIVPSDRQISDEMIKAIAARNGVIGINYFDKFLLPQDELKARRANLKDVVRHIDRICQLTGSAAHVGIGTDMDGGLGRENIPHEIQTSADLALLADALHTANFPDPQISQILGQNFATFFRQNLPTHHRA